MSHVVLTDAGIGSVHAVMVHVVHTCPTSTAVMSLWWLDPFTLMTPRISSVIRLYVCRNMYSSRMAPYHIPVQYDQATIHSQGNNMFKHEPMQHPSVMRCIKEYIWYKEKGIPQVYQSSMSHDQGSHEHTKKPVTHRLPPQLLPG